MTIHPALPDGLPDNVNEGGSRAMRTPIIQRRGAMAPIVVAAMLATLLLASTANAGSLSADQLTARGWTCVPFVPANRTS